jgi:predicted outer membrane repeat protein
MKTIITIIGFVIVFGVTPLSANVKVQSSGITYPTIQQGVDNALSEDHLLVTTGLYVENVSVSNKQLFIEGGYLPSFTETTNVPGLTVVSGSNGFLQSTFLVAWDSVVKFQLLEIIRGGTFFGGGISVADNCAVTSITCNIIENLALLGGGCFAGSNAVLFLQDTIVVRNEAVAGGGVFGSLDSKVTAEGFGTRFFENYAGSGAAIAGDKSTVNFGFGATIHFNIAADNGGGIALKNNSRCIIQGGGITTFIGTSIAKLLVTNGNGGGIYAENSSIEILDEKCYIGSATVSHFGGGVYLTNSSLKLLNGARIGDFSPMSYLCASNGGAVYMIDSILIVSNNAKIYRGCAEFIGGGIFAERSTVSFYENSVLGSVNSNFGNRATYGGGMVTLFCTTKFDNSTIMGNFAGIGGGVYLAGLGNYRFTGCNISENFASNACGAIATEVLAGDFIIENTDIISNRSDGACGGVMIMSISNSFIRDSKLSWNEAKDDIGALYLISFGTSTTTIQNTQITFNKAGNNMGAIGAGDAVLNFTDCIIAQNSANSVSGMAGAVYLSGGSALFEAKSSNAYLDDNTAGIGGAIYAENKTRIKICCTNPVRNYFISGNSATKYGGAIYLNNSVTAEISGRILFEYNNAYKGGGAFLTNKSYMALLSTNNLSPAFFDNTAGKYGGGIAVMKDSSLKTVNSLFVHNISSNDGGAIYASRADVDISADDFAMAKILGLPASVFDANHADSGAAVYVSYSKLRISDTLIVSNSARSGGGMSIISSTVDVINTVVVHNFTEDAIFPGNIYLCGAKVFRAVYCTIAENSNAGVWSECSFPPSGTVLMTNCIIWGNTGMQISTSSYIHVDYCDVQGGFPTGVGNIDADPLFADAAQYNFALTASSPCINTGIVAGIGYDCIGEVRPFGGGYDLGAYEFVPEPGFCLLFVIGNLILLKIKFSET